MNFLIAMKRCLATSFWLRGISSGVAAMLKPVPIGLSRKSRPKILFHGLGLGLRFRSWFTSHGPSSNKFASIEEQPGPPWSQIKIGVCEIGVFLGGV